MLPHPCPVAQQHTQYSLRVSPAQDDRARVSVVVQAADDGTRGALFERTCRLFLDTLGYPGGRSVPSAGRQIDLVARHAHENRYAIAECKAHTDRIGGRTINTFRGAAIAERQTLDAPAALYFIALGGFRASAIAQEAKARKSGDSHVELIDGESVVSRLCDAQAIVSAERAYGVADLVVGGRRRLKTTLWITGIGLLWAISHEDDDPSSAALVLVHGSDGELVSAHAATRLMAAGGQSPAEETWNPLEGYRLLGTASPFAGAQVAECYESYARLIRAQHGEVTTEGIAGDAYASATSVQLDAIYAPQTISGDGRTMSVDDAVQLNRLVAVLAVPGGGKTTLVRRLATTALSETAAVESGSEHVLPLVARCREIDPDVDLREALVAGPIRELGEQYLPAFQQLAKESLHSGDALVLIDGLDEVADDAARRRLVAAIGRFVDAYPSVSVVVTARPAGFRHVAAAMATRFAIYHLDGLSDSAITWICRRWHEIFDGQSPEASEKGERLAGRVMSTPRVADLARVPLLLTTLLLVDRAVGQLPKKRGALYDRALDVLLMTWNVEAFEPLDRDDIVPQLCWLAFHMQENAMIRATQRTVIEEVRLARRAMPELFGRDTLGIGAFLKQVELRSSLLVFVGWVDVEDDEAQPSTVPLGDDSPSLGRERTFEFRHLTFQEYLAARAIVDDMCAPRIAGASAAEVLKRHIWDTRWKEVVLLSIAHADRRAGEIVEVLVQALRSSPWDNPDTLDAEAGRTKYLCGLLVDCLLDDPKLRPNLRESVFDVIVDSIGHPTRDIVDLNRIRHGALGLELLDALLRAFLSGAWPDSVRAGAMLKALTRSDWVARLPEVYGTDQPWVIDLHQRVSDRCFATYDDAGSPGWIRGDESAQLDHVLQAIGAPRSGRLHALGCRAATLAANDGALTVDDRVTLRRAVEGIGPATPPVLAAIAALDDTA